MATDLIFSNADFSENGIRETYDFTSEVSLAGKWYPQKYIGNLNASGPPIDNAKRCCILRFNVSSLSAYATASKIKLTVVSGFDYVFATGDDTAIISQDHWQRVTGNETYDLTFAWVTDNQEAISKKMPYINLNLRYDDNTTEFHADAVITDYIKLELI
jgi:hypothetical protein